MRCHRAPVVLMSLLGGVLHQPLWAIVITPTQNNIAVTEGNPGSFAFVVTNDTSSSHRIGGVGFSVFPTDGPDASDDVNFAPFPMNPPAGVCNTDVILAAGATCTVTLNFTTPLTAPNFEGPGSDWGVTRSRVLVGFDDGSSALADVFVRVDDTPLPPPAPLLTIGNASVNEGDGGNIPFSITSTAGVMQVVTSRIVSAVALAGPPANDSTDDISITPLGCDVGTLLFPAIPCVGVITFTTPKTVNEAEDDIDGTNSVQLTVSVDNTAPVTANGVVAVHDITSTVPEPGSASVLLLGLLFLGSWRIRSKQMS